MLYAVARQPPWHKYLRSQCEQTPTLSTSVPRTRRITGEFRKMSRMSSSRTLPHMNSLCEGNGHGWTRQVGWMLFNNDGRKVLDLFCRHWTLDQVVGRVAEDYKLSSEAATETVTNFTQSMVAATLTHTKL